MNKSVFAVMLAFGVPVSSAQAEWEWKGFLTASAAISDVKYLPTGVEPLYAEHIGKQISFDKDSVLGLKIKKQLDESISAVGQLVASGERDWDVKATEAFFKYSPTEKWHWRFGRQPVEFLIHSDDVYETFNHPWVGLPESLYDMIPYHYLDAASAGIKFTLWDVDFKLKAMYGALTEHTRTPITDIELKYKLRQFFNTSLRIGNEIFKVHASYSIGKVTWGPNAAHEAVNNYINTLIPPALIGIDYQNYLSVQNDSLQYQSVGYAFQWKRLMSYAEYFRRKSSAVVIPDINAWYAMFGAKFMGGKVMPYVTVARQRVTDNDTRRFVTSANTAALAAPPAGLGNTLNNVVQAIAEGIDGPAAGDQTSYMFGVRWNMLEQVSVKAQFEHNHPDRYGTGLFHVHPHKSVKIYRIAVDSSFSIA